MEKKIDWKECPEDVVASARAFYERYIRNSDGLNFAGQQCPPWDDLGDKVKSHWCATVLTARQRAADGVL